MPYPHHLHTPDRPCPVCRDIIAAQQNRHIVEIIILKDEVIHDVDASTLKVEKARKIEDVPIATDDKERYSLTRTIDKAITNVLRPLSPYLLLPSPFVHSIASNHIHDWSEKDILIALPPRWPPHLIDTLRNTIHYYIVKSAEHEELLPVLPNDPYTTLCSQQADDALDDINAIVSTRLGPSLIHPSFLG